jgi:hypothetical protein
MTSRLNALATLVDGDDSFGFTNYEDLKANSDYLVVEGAAVGALDVGNTVDITNEYHQVTVAGGSNIDNITDALGAVAGQQVRLAFSNYQTVRNHAGGTGNIRTVSGGDELVAPNEIVTFTFDGANWWKSKPASFVVARDTSLVDIVSSTTETDLIGAAGTGVAIPGGLLGTSRKLHIRMIGDMLLNTGSVNGVLRVYYGAASIASDQLKISVATANRNCVMLDAVIAAIAATNAQALQGVALMQGASVVPASLPASNTTKGWADGAVDSTAAQNLRVTIQLSASSANLEFRKRYISVEVI